MVGRDIEDEDIDVETEVVDLGNGDKQNHPPYDDVQERHQRRHVLHQYFSRGLRTLWRLIVEQGSEGFRLHVGSILK